MLSQENCIGRLTTPLGADKLCLVELSASEGISELFTFDIQAVSEDADIQFDKLIGYPCHIAVEHGTLGKRSYHGVVVEAQWEHSEADLHYYRLIARPWLWLLSKTSDCRIYHDKTALDIISETFRRHGFSDFEPKTTETYPKLHYTVQYRESDLNFVHRLMEQHGIYYFFRHSAEKHMMVLADGASCHTPAPKLASVKFNPHGHNRRDAAEPTLDDWTLNRRLRSGKVELNDYNHSTPTTPLKGNKAAAEKYNHAQFEIFDHPGVHTTRDHGETYAKVRLEAEQCGDKRRHARGNAVALHPGALVALTGHPREDAKYLCVRVASHVGPQDYRGGNDSHGDDRGYEAAYELQKIDIPHRAPLVTPKPLIHSLQTAWVVGKKGEEIDCDDHGRILVHFHWDRHEDRSCRIRVSQIWAGQSWGGQAIPRIGMEVMVAFLEGDPDRPIVVGCVPNPQNRKVPDTLPDYKTRMVLKSKTHKGEGFNELRFEDEKDQEEIWLHAQKYLNAKILNNETWKVGANRHKQIASNESESIGGNKDIDVQGRRREHVKGSHNLTVDAARRAYIDANDSLKVGGNRTENFGGQWTCVVGADALVQTSGNIEIKSGGSTYIKAGSTLVIEAGAGITLKVGGNFITINASGVAIQGTMVLINSGGAALSGTEVAAKTPTEPRKYEGPAAKRYDRSYKL